MRAVRGYLCAVRPSATGRGALMLAAAIAVLFGTAAVSAQR